MKTITATPVIFSSFGREKAETIYHLPDFLFGYVVSGHGILRVGSQSCEVATGNRFLVARWQEASVTLFPGEGEEGYFHTINICISEAEVEDYFLHATHYTNASAASGGLFRILPDHPLLHGLALLLEDGIRQGFRAGPHSHSSSASAICRLSVIASPVITAFCNGISSDKFCNCGRRGKRN